MSRSNRSSAVLLRASCAALGLAAGLVVLGAPAPARAEDNFYAATWGRVLEGFGLKKADEQEIDYRERPPLVLPNGRNLPPPEKVDATAANPAWPKDPDVKRRKLIEAEKKGRMTSDVREREQNPLSEAELTPGPKPAGVKSTNTGPGRSGATDFGEMLSPSELGFKGGLFGRMFHGKDEDVVQFTGEPPRNELTEPPPGYQTPSPNQPYGVGQAPAPKPDNDYETRNELKR